jgi:Family of unknown function (DUF6932)
MSLPDLNADGELPVGVHPAPLSELLARFGTGSAQREQVAERIRNVLELAQSTGHLHRFIVFGSFVTAKTEPRDADIILVMRDEFQLEHCPPAARVLFDHMRAETELGASVFWIRPCLLIGDSLDQFVQTWQRKRDGGRRGIVEIVA